MPVAELDRAAPAGPLLPVDIGHPVYAAVTDPNTAFWALVDKTRVSETLASGALLDAFHAKADEFTRELHALRLIADGKADDYLWGSWDADTETTFLLQ